MSTPGSAGSTAPARPKRTRAGLDSPATAFGGSGFWIKLVLMLLIDATGLFVAMSAARQGQWAILGADVVLLLVANYVYFSRRRLPAKYIMPGLVFLLIYQVFTMGYTGYVAFTNYGFGHNGTKPAAIDAILAQTEKRVEGSSAYPITVVSDGGTLGLALVYDGEPQVGTNDTPLAPAEGATVDDGKVTALEGYDVLSFSDMLSRQNDVTSLRVAISADAEDGSLRTTDGSTAYVYRSTYTYDPASDSLIESSTGTALQADNSIGSFVDAGGTPINPGWRVTVGFANFAKMFDSTAGLGNSLWKIGLWTICFAFLTAAINFLVGLFLALVFNSPHLRGRRVLRSLLILPYAFPAFLTFLLWRGMLNADFGFVNEVVLGGAHIPWLTSPWLAKLSIIVVNLWSGYSYMFLVTTGALQAIPTDCLESAQIDGAGGMRVFRSITMPMVFIATAPLIIATFAFNFNNFNVIYLLTQGGPTFDATAAVNLGATDILISAVYRVSGIDGTGTTDYGLASAMSIVIFVVVGLIALVSFRQTRKSEELI